MPQTIGERLKMLREKNRMTLEEVASRLNIGRPTVFKYENGSVTNIPSDKIEILAKIYNVSPAYIMGWDENTDDMPKPKNEEIRLLISGLNKLSPEQVEQAKNVMKAMFAQYADFFEKGDSDET